MYAVVSAERTQIPIGSVMRIPGSWEDYCELRDSRGNGSIPRIKYQNGEVLLMSPLQSARSMAVEKKSAEHLFVQY